MRKKALPIGVDNFEKVIKGGYYAAVSTEFERHRDTVERGKASLSLREYEQYIEIAEGKADASGIMNYADKLIDRAIKLNR